MGGSSGGRGAAAAPHALALPPAAPSMYLDDIDVPYRAYMLAPLALVPALLCPL